MLDSAVQTIRLFQHRLGGSPPTRTVSVRATLASRRPCAVLASHLVLHLLPRQAGVARRSPRGAERPSRNLGSHDDARTCTRPGARAWAGAGTGPPAGRGVFFFRLRDVFILLPSGWRKIRSRKKKKAARCSCSVLNSVSRAERSIFSRDRSHVVDAKCHRIGRSNQEHVHRHFIGGSARHEGSAST